MSNIVLDGIKAKMAEAVKVFTATGDMSGIQAVTAEMNKAKGEIAKVESVRLLKESEALAGEREGLATSIFLVIKNATKPLSVDLAKSLVAVKAKGFTYTIDHRETDKGVIDANGEVSVKGGVGLLVTALKAHKGGGNGGSGKSKDEYGMSLADIVDKFATAEEAAAINAEGISNSKSWQLKVAVKKQAIADGKLAPVK